jgi:putative flippase GtrA
MRDEKRHLGRFLVVGGLSVATDLGVLLALHAGLGWERSLAKGLSYVAGMALGFALNKAWTFGSRRQAWTEAPSYVLLYALTLAVNVGVHRALHDLGLGGGLAFLGATGLTTVLNYLGLRYITFRQGIAERHKGTL